MHSSTSISGTSWGTRWATYCPTSNAEIHLEQFDPLPEMMVLTWSMAWATMALPFVTVNKGAGKKIGSSLSSGMVAGFVNSNG